MKNYNSNQTIEQLEKRKGGYYYLKVDASIADQFAHKRKTRLICRLDHKLSFQCGLNHLGDGNFFIIISTKNLKSINRQVGDLVPFQLTEDPNPLGIDMPPTIEALLQQDAEIKSKFDQLTNGKKRSILVQVSKIKDMDKQISRTAELVSNLALQPYMRR
ncbi:MAG: YdeI/OmpD-associated family protein [Taibaiella sp.]|nr:YdeI/OmpD-associated family protein [Taibaiella sp.]